MLVMDNASCHKSQRAQELIEPAGAHILFSPDVNKIEKFWARLKYLLRTPLTQFEDFWEAVDDAFRKLSYPLLRM